MLVHGRDDPAVLCDLVLGIRIGEVLTAVGVLAAPIGAVAVGAGRIGRLMLSQQVTVRLQTLREFFRQLDMRCGDGVQPVVMLLIERACLNSIAVDRGAVHHIDDRDVEGSEGRIILEFILDQLAVI